jgi:hypothetical protein
MEQRGTALFCGHDPADKSGRYCFVITMRKSISHGNKGSQGGTPRSGRIAPLTALIAGMTRNR